MLLSCHSIAKKDRRSLYSNNSKYFVTVAVLLGSQREYEVADSCLLPKQCDASDAGEQPSFRWLLWYQKCLCMFGISSYSSFFVKLKARVNYCLRGG